MADKLDKKVIAEYLAVEAGSRCGIIEFAVFDQHWNLTTAAARKGDQVTTEAVQHIPGRLGRFAFIA
jgi:hypothetical protein